MIIFSSVICLFGGNVAASECPFDISCQAMGRQPACRQTPVSLEIGDNVPRRPWL
jgi:hypothetical protein